MPRGGACYGGGVGSEVHGLRKVAAPLPLLLVCVLRGATTPSLGMPSPKPSIGSKACQRRTRRPRGSLRAA
eukprot:7060991-Alexandrium_andersonii.AAC.1